jgi:hypothetical protein
VLLRGLEDFVERDFSVLVKNQREAFSSVLSLINWGPNEICFVKSESVSDSDFSASKRGMIDSSITKKIARIRESVRFRKAARLNCHLVFAFVEAVRGTAGEGTTPRFSRQ